MAKIYLDKFKLRPYQAKLARAFDSGCKRLVAIWPRRAGKDLVCWNLLIESAWKRVGTYFLVYPTYSQGRKILFDATTIQGDRFLSFLPKEIIESVNITEMKVRLKAPPGKDSGSLIQVVGSDNYDSLVGTNPLGCIFSEYALQDPRGYQFLRPALTANDGWAIFISTPRGKNSLWELWNIASNNSPAWFAERLTVEDTGHISIEEIHNEIARGEISYDLAQQEYWCSFDLGVEGSYYSKYMDNLRLKGQIGPVPWEPAFKVHVALDIGVRDSTSLIWFQCIGQTIRIIDCYEKSKEGLEHYAKIIQQKPYQMGRYIAPHDIAVTEWGSGMTRLAKAKDLGK